MGELLFIAVVVGLALILYLGHRAKVKRQEEERKRQEEAYRQRRESLISKYGTEQIADDIMAHRIWQGMTAEQLADSWGRPEDVDQKVYKQKTSETWKYGRIGKNRYRQRVFTENGVVVGWQEH
jgi:hypothetical protein